VSGHLRRDLDPEMEVDVEILDVNEEEARKLLLSIDPLAALAETQSQIHERLLEVTPAEWPELDAAWKTATNAALASDPQIYASVAMKEQFLILVTCRDEEHQVDLLERFGRDGLTCTVLLSQRIDKTGSLNAFGLVLNVRRTRITHGFLKNRHPFCRTLRPRRL
jgi:hypothetical protein